MSNITQGIAELICMANGERYENLTTQDRQRIETYAESILTYVKSHRS